MRLESYKGNNYKRPKIRDFKDIKKLIKQAIKMDNRIYQSKKAKKELSRLL